MMFKIFVAIFAVAFCLAQLSDQMTIYSDRDVDEDNDWEKFKVNNFKIKFSSSPILIVFTYILLTWYLPYCSIINYHWQNETKKDYKKNKTEEASRKALFSRRRKDIIANNNNKSKPFKMAINLFSDRVYIS